MKLKEKLNQKLIDVISEDVGYINNIDEILDKTYVYIHYSLLDTYKLKRLLDFGKIVSIIYHINERNGDLTYCVGLELDK